MAKDVRGSVEQMLSVMPPSYEPEGGRYHPHPFGDVLPGFFEFLVEERGLCPASVLGYRHHLDCFEGYLRRIGIESIQELSSTIFSAYIVDLAGSELARSTVCDGAGVLWVFFRYVHREDVLKGDRSAAVGWPQVHGLSKPRRVLTPPSFATPSSTQTLASDPGGLFSTSARKRQSVVGGSTSRSVNSHRPSVEAERSARGHRPLLRASPFS